MNTDQLIAELSTQTPQAPLRTPLHYALALAAMLLVYALATQAVLGLRVDLAAQLSRPFFVLELTLLAALTLSSARAAVLCLYPDSYQQRRWLKLPYLIFAALVAFLLLQLPMAPDDRMMLPETSVHGMECALCIASVSLIPSALIFLLLRRGASVHPLRAGSYAVLAATGIGALTLRLAEADDFLPHLLIWHYLPTLLFSALGAILGKYLLRW